MPVLVLMLMLMSHTSLDFIVLFVVLSFVLACACVASEEQAIVFKFTNIKRLCIMHTWTKIKILLGAGCIKDV